MLAIKFAAALLCALVAVSSVTDAGNPPIKASPKNLTDRELFVIYGAIVRANYSKGTQLGFDTPEFQALERELEQRKLLTTRVFEDIQRGIVSLKMPLVQAFASMQGLTLEESFKFESFNLEVFRGRAVQYRNGSFIRERFEKLLVCNGKIVGLNAYGVPLIENYKRLQTNFAPDFFHKNSIAAKRYLRAGKRPPKERRWDYKASGGYLWMIHRVAAHNRQRLLRRRNWKPGPGMKWSQLINNRIEEGDFKWFVRYFGRHC